VRALATLSFTIDQAVGLLHDLSIVLRRLIMQCDLLLKVCGFLAFGYA
jgi:hypothetical protein